jgi:hypothetical protein
LYAISLTPFEIAVGWQAPDDKDFEDPGHVLGYHVSVLDEYHVVLREKNVSDTLMTIQNMAPSTRYGVCFVYVTNMKKSCITNMPK